jgi:hypothetical protein
VQGNQLGSRWTHKIVVVAEPALFIPPPPRKQAPLISKLIKHKLTADDFNVNRAMVQFIVSTKYVRSMPTEVWTFLPEDIIEELAVKLDKISGDAVLRWERWDAEEDALLALKVDPTIHTVYDADPDRVERLWHLRGHRVIFGGAPSL